VPWIIAAPWKPATHGIVTTALVENVDLYQTLASAAGLPAPDTACATCVQGIDATPLLDEPFRQWKRASFSQYARCDYDNSTGYYARCSGDDRSQIQVMGYSVRTSSWRYVESEQSAHLACARVRVVDTLSQ
jgi:iduronate 2-sulfatase